MGPVVPSLTVLGGVGSESTRPVDSPSWLDPELVTHLSGSVKDTLTLPAGTNVQILGSNPERTMVVVLRGVSAAGTLRLGPSPDVDNFALIVDATNQSFVLLLTELSSLVTGDWHANLSGGGDVRVYEFIRPAVTSPAAPSSEGCRCAKKISESAGGLTEPYKPCPPTVTTPPTHSGHVPCDGAYPCASCLSRRLIKRMTGSGPSTP